MFVCIIMIDDVFPSPSIVGMLDVFGSWNKVAPHYEGAPFEGEVERQLQDAMGEQEPNSVIVTQDITVKSGFSPPGP